MNKSSQTGGAASLWQRLLLRSNFALLFAGQTLSACGDWFRAVTTIGLIYAWTKSTSSLSFLFIAATLPVVLASALAGPFIDRYPRKHIMICTDLLRAGANIGMIQAVHAASPSQLFFFTALSSFFSGIYAPARSALIPEIVPKERLVSANGLLTMAFSAMMVFATAVGGYVTHLLSNEAIFLIDAATFLVAAITVTFIRPQYTSQPAKASSYFAQVVAGLREIKHTPVLRGALWVSTARETAFGILYVIWSLYILRDLQQGNVGLGLAHMAAGIGIVCGGWCARTYLGRHPLTVQIYRAWSSLALLALGLFLALAFAQHTFWLFLAVIVLLDTAYGTIDVSGASAIMTFASAQARGRIFAAFIALPRLAYATGLLAFSAVGERWPIFGVALGLACFLVLAGLVNVWVCGASRRTLRHRLSGEQRTF